MENTSGKRLNKFISDSGFCSRREADKLIEQQRVTINGQTPELGTKVMPGDLVKVNGKAINEIASNKSDRVYIAYHKPIGITCTTERHVRGNIIDAIKHKERIFPIGRLDKPSEGLIFLTSDGDIVNKILRAENAHDKEYIVTVDKPISERFINRMAKGVPILGTITDPCRVSMQSKYVFKIILTQGLNRQIRRMCEYLDYEVTKLKRTRIMNIDLTGLRPGQWRNFTEQELADINAAVATSSKTSSKVADTSHMPNSNQTSELKNDSKPSERAAKPSHHSFEENKRDKPKSYGKSKAPVRFTPKGKEEIAKGTKTKKTGRSTLSLGKK